MKTLSITVIRQNMPSFRRDKWFDNELTIILPLKIINWAVLSTVVDLLTFMGLFVSIFIFESLILNILIV